MSENIRLQLNVNGHQHDLAVDPRATLLDALRENLQAKSPELLSIEEARKNKLNLF